MSSSWDDTRRAFASAAEWFVRTTGQVEDRWDRPGLGEWDVRALVGHTSRALLTVEAYLRQPADSVAVADPADYFRVVRSVASPESVAERGRESGAALGPDPHAAVEEIAARVVPLLDERTGAEIVTTVVGGMRLADYLPTRTFELVVHTCDLATALGEPLELPLGAAEQALAIVSGLAIRDGSAGRLLLTATGRPLGDGGFTVL